MAGGFSIPQLRNWRKDIQWYKPTHQPNGTQRKGWLLRVQQRQEHLFQTSSRVELGSFKQLDMPDKYIFRKECVAEDLTASQLAFLEAKFLQE